MLLSGPGKTKNWICQYEGCWYPYHVQLQGFGVKKSGVRRLDFPLVFFAKKRRAIKWQLEENGDMNFFLNDRKYLSLCTC